MKRFTLIALTLLAFGCTPKKPSRSSAAVTGGSSGSGSGGSGGAAQAVRGAVQRHVAAVEMHELHLFIENYSAASGSMPTKEIILEVVKKESPKLYQMLQDGSIVLTGLQKREGVWAYQKDAPTQGGWILTQNGEERLDAAEVKKRLMEQ
jgi:hypothetical protein